jgi:hypothetical protein
MGNLVITRPKNPPRGSDPAAVFDWLIEALTKLLAYVASLVSLDEDLRRLRSEAAERGVLFVSAAVTNAAVVAMQTIAPSVVTEVYTTALIMFDSTSPLGRFRYDGGSPVAAVGAASGMPIPAGFSFITLVGALNIRSFQIIAEGAGTIQMSITLHK